VPIPAVLLLLALKKREKLIEKRTSSGEETQTATPCDEPVHHRGVDASRICHGVTSNKIKKGNRPKPRNRGKAIIRI
jgi:hypothetical protein